MKIPFVGIVKNIIAIPLSIIATLFVVMFFYYFFLFFAYDLNPDFVKMNQCDRYDGTWDGVARRCVLQPY